MSVAVAKKGRKHERRKASEQSDDYVSESHVGDLRVKDARPLRAH
jgi:hypothetical protein